MTLNQLIALFQAIGTAHYFIKTTEFGEVPDKVEANTESSIYPVFYQVPTNTITRDQVVERSFQLLVLDLVYPGHDNLNEVLSDTEQTLNDIIKILRQESDDYTLINDPVLTPLKDVFGDAVAGWAVEVTIQTVNNNGFCDIPAIDFGYPGQGGTPGIPLPTFGCDDLIDCPTIETINETLVDLQEQIDNLPPSNNTLAQTLGYGNSTNNISITAGTNLSNILQVSDTVIGLSWNGTVGGNVTLDDTFATIYHDLLTQIESQGQVDILGPIINLNGNTNINGSLNQIYYDGPNNDWSQILSDVYSAGLFTGSGLTSQNNQVYALQGQGVGLFVTDDLNSIASRFDIWSSAQSVSDLSINNYITVDDALGNKGIVYASDYSANFTDNSLVTKAWVLAQTPAAPSLQTVINVSSVINGFLAQSLDNGTYITLTNSGIDMSTYDGTTTSGFNMYAATGNNLYSDVLNTFNAPLHIFNNDIQLSSATVNTLTYFDGSKYLKSVTLGTGLSLVSGTLSATATTPSLSSVLAVGNTSGANDIVMSTTRVIKSANGGGELGLNGGSYGIAGSVYLTNDNNGFTKSFLSFDDTLYGYKNYISLTACDTSTNSLTGNINIGIYSNNVSAYKTLLTLNSTIATLMFKTANISLIDAQINLNATTSIVSGILRMNANTANTLVYHDASKNLKSVTLGAGLSLASGTLSATSTTPTLAQVLTAGNSTGNQNITSLNTNNILEVSDTAISLNWNDTNNGSVILNNSFIKLTHDTFVTIDTLQTLILGEFHHILTDVNTITRIDTVAGSVLLSVDRTLGGENQIYVHQYLTGIAASNTSSIVSKLEIHTTQQSLLVGDPSTNNTMIITDAISNKGLVYVDDYSANFTENSLVTKSYTDGKFNLAEQLANKQNDLTIDGTGTKYPTVDAVNQALADAKSNCLAMNYIFSSGLMKY